MKASVQTPTMGIFLAVLVFTVMILSIIPLSFGQGTQLKVDAPTTDILVTTQFNVNITIVDVTDLYAWQIKLYYNNATLLWLNATYPPGHVFDGRNFVQVNATNDSDAGGAYVLFFATLVGNVTGFSGNGTLCQIKFRAQNPGSSSLNFSRPFGGDTFLWDSNLMDIPATLVDGSVSAVVIPDVTKPITINNYDGLWHTTDFTVTLTATDDLIGVAETYYKMNNGPTKAVSADGQPRVTTESANNTLEYWSVDNAGNEEVHHFLAGVKLDKTAPAGTIKINAGASYTNKTAVALTLSAMDATSGTAVMHFSNDNITYTNWQTYAPSKPWILQGVDGSKTVYMQLRDYAGLVSPAFFSTIILDSTPPTISITSPLDGSEVKSSTVTVTWTGADATSGIDHYEIRLNGGSWTNVGTNTTYAASGLGDGAHTLEVEAIDKAGMIRLSSVSFTANTSLLFGPGYIEEIIILATTILAVLGIALYFFKIKKH